MADVKVKHNYPKFGLMASNADTKTETKDASGNVIEVKHNVANSGVYFYFTKEERDAQIRKMIMQGYDCYTYDLAGKAIPPAVEIAAL